MRRRSAVQVMKSLVFNPEEYESGLEGFNVILSKRSLFEQFKSTHKHLHLLKKCILLFLFMRNI